MYQFARYYGLICRRLMSVWDVEKFLKVDTSSCLLFGHRKMCGYMYSIHFTHSVRGDLLLSLRHRRMSEAWCALFLDRNRCVLSRLYSFVFYPSVSVGSLNAESIFPVFHRGRLENDVNL